MMDLPEDVRKAAMFHLRSMEADVEEKADGQWQVKGFGLRDAIARAILAERERCAQLAATEASNWSMRRDGQATADAMTMLSSSILGLTPNPQATGR